MKKNWLKFISFCVIAMLVFTWFNKAMEIPSQNWLDFYDLPQDSLDVVFIGNSHGLKGFQPNILSDLMPVSSYMVGVPGENVFISYYELREILKTQKPKILILETFTLNLTEPVGKALIFPFTDAGSWSMNKLAVMRRFLSYDLFYSSIPSLRTRVDWNHPADFFAKIATAIKVKETRSTSRFLGAAPDPEPLSAAEFAEIATLPDVTSTRSPLENRLYLDKIVELCEKNNIKLILVSTPVLKITGPFFSYYTPFDVASYARENGVELVTFDSSELNKMHYVDADHLSIFGSLIVTLDLAREISQNLGVQIDPERMNYYEGILFSDFSMECHKQTCTLSLEPEDPAADLRYKFVLMDQRYQALYATDFQKENKFSFVISDEKIHVQVNILQPDGEYEVTAYFNNY